MAIAKSPRKALLFEQAKNVRVEVSPERDEQTRRRCLPTGSRICNSGFRWLSVLNSGTGGQLLRN